MKPSESIGQRIKLVRGALSQKAFGARIGLSQTAVTALETNQSEPRLGTFNSIVTAFGTNPEWLRTGQGEMKPARMAVAEETRAAAAPFHAQEPAAAYAKTAATPDALVQQLINQLAEEKKHHREEMRELKRDHREDLTNASLNQQNLLAGMRRQIDEAKEETVRVREEKDEQIRHLQHEVHMLKLAAGQRGPTAEEREYMERAEEERRAQEAQTKKQAGFRPEGVVGVMALSYYDPAFIRPQPATEASPLKIAA